MKKCKYLGAIAALAIAGYAGMANAQSEMKIGYGTINDPQHAIALEIQKRIGGNKDLGIKVSVFPAGQIGKIPRMIEGLQFGTLEALITPPGFLVGINPAFQVPDAPGLFNDINHAFRSLNDGAVCNLDWKL